MIYLIAAVVIIALIIGHVKDVRSVKKAKQDGKELIKELEKEIEELNKDQIYFENKAKELWDEYIDICIESGDDHYHEDGYRRTL